MRFPSGQCRLPTQFRSHRAAIVNVRFCQKLPIGQLDAADFIRDAFRDDLQITGGVLTSECAQLYYGPDDDVPCEEQGNV